MKYEITVSGDNNSDYEDLELLAKNTEDCHAEFSEYFDMDATYKDVVIGGYMDFQFEDGKFKTETYYESNRRLTDTELEHLKEYTVGQWSDGIGEGYEQEPAFIDDEGEEVYVNPWHSKQVVTIKQEIEE